MRNSYNQFADTTIATIKIGTLSKAFKVITDDYTPNPFILQSIENAELGTIYQSDTVTITGLPHPTPLGTAKISYSESNLGTIYINGIAHSDEDLSLVNGDEVYIELMSQEAYDTTATSTLIINNQETTFEVTTKANPLQRKAAFPLNELIISGFVADDTFYALTSTNSLYQYNPSSNTWVQKSNFTGEPRMRATSFSINNNGYVGLGHTIEGSENGTEKYLKDFWKYDSERDLWTKIADFGGESRAEAYGYAQSDMAYVVTVALSTRILGSMIPSQIPGQKKLIFLLRVEMTPLHSHITVKDMSV